MPTSGATPNSTSNEQLQSFCMAEMGAVGTCNRPLPEQLAAQEEAAVEEEETGPDLGTKRQYLVVMRHGERLDEIDVSWRAQSKRPWDPPLSPKGEKQV